MRHSLAGRAESPMQARLLAQLRDEGPLSKAQLADRLQASRTTIGAEVTRLGELGLAIEAGPAASRGGRRSTLVDLSPDIRFAGISIGATGLSVGVTDGRLTTLAVAHRQCDIKQGPESVLALALEVVREVMAEAGVSRLSGAGVGVPGPVDFHRGVSVSPPIMPGWDGYPVRDAVSRDLGCPVVLDNDVNVLAVGEQHAGVARNARDFLFVKIGTGIGCGIVVDGELYRGVDGCAGDIGHIRVDDFGPTCACGNTGCLEAFAGGAALARDATAAARSGRSEALAALLEEKGELTAADVGARRRPGRPGGRPADPRQRAPRRPGPGQPGLVLQPRPDRHRRRRDRPRSLAARRDPRRHLPPLAPARHRQPPDRAQRAGRRGRRHRRRPADQRGGLLVRPEPLGLSPSGSSVALSDGSRYANFVHQIRKFERKLHNVAPQPCQSRL